MFTIQCRVQLSMFNLKGKSDVSICCQRPLSAVNFIGLSAPFRVTGGLRFFLVVNLVIFPAVVILAFFNQVGIAMNVDMKILIQL